MTYPLLFNLYSNHKFKEAMEGLANNGIKINEVPLTTIRYEDITVIQSYTVEELHEFLNSINTIDEKFTLNTNIVKTKIMILHLTSK